MADSAIDILIPKCQYANEVPNPTGQTDNSAVAVPILKHETTGEPSAASLVPFRTAADDLGCDSGTSRYQAPDSSTVLPHTDVCQTVDSLAKRSPQGISMIAVLLLST